MSILQALNLEDQKQSSIYAKVIYKKAPLYNDTYSEKSNGMYVIKGDRVEILDVIDNGRVWIQFCGKKINGLLMAQEKENCTITFHQKNMVVTIRDVDGHCKAFNCGANAYIDGIIFLHKNYCKRYDFRRYADKSLIQLFWGKQIQNGI